jgi:outer membrane protein assembly factor BamB
MVSLVRAKKVFIVVLALFFVGISFGADWPQWRGIDRDGQSAETGLLKKWPDGGPKLRWFTEGLGEGHSSISVCNGMIYTTGNKGDKGKKSKVEYITAMDLKGTIKWQKPYGKAWNKSYPEARSCPTINDGMAYVVTGKGVASCFDAKTGEKKWTRDVFTEYEGEYSPWGIGKSPLVVDDKVICTPGGAKATMVALDKKTGKVVWASKSIDDKASYCSPILVERGGKKIIVELVAKHIIGVDAASGDILWNFDCKEYQPKPRGINCVSPIYHDGGIYITSGYDMGSIKLGLSADGSSVEKLWTNIDMDTHKGGVVLIDGHIYGTSWDGNSKGTWQCVDWKTGKTIYDTKWGTMGQVITADGMLYCYEQKSGKLGLVKATPDGFDVVSSFEIPHGEGIHWAHPAISDGVLYVRHNDVLMAYAIKAE